MSLLAKVRRWSLPTKISLSIGALGLIIALVAYVFPQTSPDEATVTNTDSGTQVVGSVSNTGSGTQVVGSGNTVVVAPTRPAQLIESVDLTISFSVPLDNPALSDYADRLDKGLREYLAGDLWDTQKGIGFRTRQSSVLGNPDSGPVGQVWVAAGHPLFPSHDAQMGFPRNSLAIGAIELAFYRTPISPTDFRVSRGGEFIFSGRRAKRLEPDLGIMKPTPRAADWALWASVRPTAITYRLTLIQRWVPPKPSWNQDSGRIELMQDLPGSQLMINIGRHRSGTATPAVTGDFELIEITLRVNNRTVAITPNNVTKHLTEGDPFWEFRFPSELDEAFAAE